MVLTGVLEVLLAELLESLLVEGVLQVLKGQRELEDSDVDVLALLEISRQGTSKAGEGSRGRDEGTCNHSEC